MHIYTYIYTIYILQGTPHGITSRCILSYIKYLGEGETYTAVALENLYW